MHARFESTMSSILRSARLWGPVGIGVESDPIAEREEIFEQALLRTTCDRATFC